MMSSGARLDSHQDVLITACPWDPRIKGEFFHQTTLSVPLRHVKEFINNIKELVKIEPKFLCILEDSNGILMRYVTSSPAFLGKEEKALHFDLTYYRSKDDPLVPRLYEDFIEEIELMAVFKYNALPHWGKNRNIAEWTDQILGLKGSVTIVKEGCELEGLCIFSEDSQFLTVLRGYMCRPEAVNPTGSVFELREADLLSNLDGNYTILVISNSRKHWKKMLRFRYHILMGCPDSIKKKLPAPSRRQHQPKVVALLYEPLECNVYVKSSLREWKQPLICKSSSTSLLLVVVPLL
ncbi:unnamed protein product, partial [Brassica oleracea]